MTRPIVKTLSHYYNHQAEKYAQTRRKFWSEKSLLLDTLTQYVEKYALKELRILEFGCGDGRFFREVLAEFADKHHITIHYVGVDISESLLAIAEETAKRCPSISAQFICADIIDYVSTCTQESFDMVVGIASFQHIQTYNERLYLMQYFYHILRYDGVVLMLNWSFSERFIKKYWKALLQGIKNYLVSFGKQAWNSLYLPRKSADGSTFYRFYHIFLLAEFRKLVLFSSFVMKKLGYLDKKAHFSSWRYAKNSFFLAQKKVILSED